MQNAPNIPNGLSMDALMKLADSPQGQALLSQLQKEHAKELERAVMQAQAGDYEQVRHTVAEFLRSPSGQEIMKQIRGSQHG